MLNQDSLAQLKGLKSKMESEKEWAEGIVKGTQSRYGFVILDDGREIFIPPDEMLKVFPSDKIHICIRPGKDNRLYAEVEKLISSNISEFTGQCVAKRDVLFVKPDLPKITRWLFVPQKMRNTATEGDYVRCKITKHPIRDGRPQAEILDVLGNKNTPNIENIYCIEKYKLPHTWSQKSLKETEELISTNETSLLEGRKDLTDKNFISIDSARTQDIDDALYAEADADADGWTLFVAIADPVAFIKPGGALQNEISERATSVYFHGDLIPMLPEELVQRLCALEENTDRPAIVCEMKICDQGEIKKHEFYEAIIRSKAKLSYYSVDKYLTGQDDELLSHATPIEPLYQLFHALRSWRENRELVMEDKQEFRWLMNEKKQIESIEPYEKLISQRLVEECMVATNRCAANFLKVNNVSGPFVNHPGFRQDRHQEVNEFLKIHASKLGPKDLQNLAHYREIIKTLSSEHQVLPLRSMINRLLARSELSIESKNHMGMNLEAYANFTSPLRKYVDFLTHVQIKSILHGNPPKSITMESLNRVAKKITQSRATTLEAERWLAANYLRKLKLEGQEVFEGTISHINSSGFTIRLSSNGLEGFVDLRKDPEKFSFEKWNARLSSVTREFQLNQKVKVNFEKINVSENYTAIFTISENCGLRSKR